MNTAKERIEAVRTALKLLADREAFIDDAAVYYYRGEDVCVAAGSDEGRAVESALTVLMANAPALLADIDRLRAELAAVRAAARPDRRRIVTARCQRCDRPQSECDRRDAHLAFSAVAKRYPKARAGMAVSSEYNDAMTRMCAAEEACKRVDWRERCLAAEAGRDALRAERDALRVAVERLVALVDAAQNKDLDRVLP